MISPSPTTQPSVDPSLSHPPGGIYDPDTEVELEAFPAANYVFDNWSGDLSGNTNPDTIIMNSNKAVTAHYTYVPPVPQLYENYITGEDQRNTISGDTWCGQSFTVQSGETHTLTSVKIKLYRVLAPGITTVAITDIVAGVPSGPDLSTGTFNGDTLPDFDPGVWIEVIMSGLSLTENTTYALIFKNATPPGEVKWRVDRSGTYPGGNVLTTTDAGSNWTIRATWDTMFEEWGTPA